MRKKLIVMASVLIALASACHKNNNDPVPPSPDGMAVSFKAEIQQFDTKVNYEKIEGQEDAFRITGWEDNDRIVCCYDKPGVEGNFVVFNYNKGEDTFEGVLPEGVGMSDLQACIYRHITNPFFDPTSMIYKTETGWSVDISQTTVSLNDDGTADCSLMGFLQKKEGSEEEYVATMTAPFSLVCVHNNTANPHRFYFTKKTAEGNIFYRAPKILMGCNTADKTGSIIQEFKADYTWVSPIIISPGHKIYFILPEMPADEQVAITCNDKAEEEISPALVCPFKPASQIETGKIYKVNVHMGENSFIVKDFERPFVFEADVKGHSVEALDDKWTTAEVLWETYGTFEVPNVGDIVTISADPAKQQIAVTAHKNGNALVAVKDAEGTILWSWHIWACEGYDPNIHIRQDDRSFSHKLRNYPDSTTIMDRNLGATERYNKDDAAKTVGLFYQWGRKDPFMGLGSLTKNTRAEDAKPAASTLAQWPEWVDPDIEQVSIDYSVKHPTTYILDNHVTSDWISEVKGGNAPDTTRWQVNKKTVYDPCPKGWMLPGGGKKGLWYKAFQLSGDDNRAHISWCPGTALADFSFDVTRTDIIFMTADWNAYYPAAGFLYVDRDDEDPKYKYTGTAGVIWTAHCSYNRVDLFYWDTMGPTALVSSALAEKASSLPIRCIKMTEGME